MDVVDKLEFFLNEKPLKEENPEVEEIIKYLSQRYIIKLEKEASKYAYAERALKSERYSVYKNISRFDVDVQKVLDALKKLGYPTVIENPRNNYISVVKRDKQSRIEIYLKNDEIERMYFMYKESPKW